MACALIIAGELIVAIFGDHTNDDGVTVDDVVSIQWSLGWKFLVVSISHPVYYEIL